MSKDPKDREGAIKVVRDYFASQAAFFQNGTKNNAQLLQFLLVAILCQPEYGSLLIIWWRR
jgi:hypothetical protein